MKLKHAIFFALTITISTGILWLLYHILILLGVSVFVILFVPKQISSFLVSISLAILLIAILAIIINKAISSLPFMELWDEGDSKSKKTRILLLATSVSLVILFSMPDTVSSLIEMANFKPHQALNSGK